MEKDILEFLNDEVFLDELLSSADIDNALQQLRKRNDMVDKFLIYTSECESFHHPDGKGFELAQKSLQCYLDFKYVQAGGEIQLNRSLFGGAVVVSDNGDNSSNCRYTLETSKKDGVKKYYMDKMGIYDLLDLIDETDKSAKAFSEFITSTKPSLQACLCQLIEKAVMDLKENKMPRYQLYGKIIEETYFIPENKLLKVDELCKHLKISKGNYYKLKNEGITLISKRLFGLEP